MLECYGGLRSRVSTVTSVRWRISHVSGVPVDVVRLSRPTPRGRETGWYYWQIPVSRGDGDFVGSFVVDETLYCSVQRASVNDMRIEMRAGMIQVFINGAPFRCCEGDIFKELAPDWGFCRSGDVVIDGGIVPQCVA